MNKSHKQTVKKRVDKKMKAQNKDDVILQPDIDEIDDDGFEEENQFPWMYVAAGVGALVLGIVILAACGAFSSPSKKSVRVPHSGDRTSHVTANGKATGAKAPKSSALLKGVGATAAVGTLGYLTKDYWWAEKQDTKEKDDLEQNLNKNGKSLQKSTWSLSGIKDSVTGMWRYPTTWTDWVIAATFTGVLILGGYKCFYSRGQTNAANTNPPDTAGQRQGQQHRREEDEVTQGGDRSNSAEGTREPEERKQNDSSRPSASGSSDDVVDHRRHPLHSQNNYDSVISESPSYDDNEQDGHRRPMGNPPYAAHGQVQQPLIPDDRRFQRQNAFGLSEADKTSVESGSIWMSKEDNKAIQIGQPNSNAETVRYRDLSDVNNVISSAIVTKIEENYEKLYKGRFMMDLNGRYCQIHDPTVRNFSGSEASRKKKMRGIEVNGSGGIRRVELKNLRLIKTWGDIQQQVDSIRELSDNGYWMMQKKDGTIDVCSYQRDEESEAQGLIKLKYLDEEGNAVFRARIDGFLDRYQILVAGMKVSWNYGAKTGIFRYPYYFFKKFFTAGLTKANLRNRGVIAAAGSSNGKPDIKSRENVRRNEGKYQIKVYATSRTDELRFWSGYWETDQEGRRCTWKLLNKLWLKSNEKILDGHGMEALETSVPLPVRNEDNSVVQAPLASAPPIQNSVRRGPRRENLRVRFEDPPNNGGGSDHPANGFLLE